MPGGFAAWTAGGRAVSTATGTQGFPVIVADGAGGAIIAFESYDGHGTHGIFAQRIGSSGQLGGGALAVPAPRMAGLSLEGLRPNPARGEVVAALSLSGDAPAVVELIDLAGRTVASRRVAGGGAQRIELADAGALAPGVYLVRLTQGVQHVTRKACIVR